jgi:hypothetical protein
MMPLIANAVVAAGNSLAASIVAKVTVTAALSLFGARLARRNRAAARHVLLAAGFAVLLVLPIASLISIWSTPRRRLTPPTERSPNFRRPPVSPRLQRFSRRYRNSSA